MGVDERAELLGSIANTIADYRAGEVAAPSTEHVDWWVEQFDGNIQLPLLREMDHVLDRTYINQETVKSFLHSLLDHEPLTGTTPQRFWPSVQFLDIQGGGRSQSDMIEIFGALLEDEHGLAVAECGVDPSSFLYLDDGVFSGNRLLSDLTDWLRADAPSKVRVDVVCMALHLGGQWYAGGRLETVAEECGKDLELHWWAAVQVENRKSEIRVSDVLRPTSLPDDEGVREYAAQLQYPVQFRSGVDVGGCGFFSSGESRHLLEQELLKAGVRIRERAPYLNIYQRPLGNWVLETLGFGTMVVTYRNCPNNAPLALWAGDPWYPLFPRRTN